MANDAKPSIVVPNTTAFISYSHKDRSFGAQAKKVLSEVGIDAFLAHDDLQVSDEWRERIIEELKRCDVFVPLLSADFMQSQWAPQEVGFIISRPEVAIAPISLDGTTPVGFMSHIQSGKVTKDGITRELLIDPLVKRIPRRIVPGLIQLVDKAGSYESAQKRMKSLVPAFPELTPDEAQALADASVRNSQVWPEWKCRTEYLPKLISAQANNIDPKTLRALKYQVEQQKWYVEEA